jgi:Na+-transporting methylmalonyl-CoA/oxaloacetate decarboxylase gamma subunit
MAIDRVLITIMGLAIVAIVLMILGQAIGQFDSVLKTVLRPPKDEPDLEPVRLRVIAPAAVAAAFAVLFLLLLFLTR